MILICGAFNNFNYFNIYKFENQWETNLWFAQQKKALEDEENKVPRYIPEITPPHDLAALFLNSLSRKGKIRILDFGGAAGGIYYHLLHRGALLYPDNIDWYVVDSATLGELGQRYGHDNKRIHFMEDIPVGETEEFDVIHISTVLQYLEDYKPTLNKLIQLNPKHFILTRLLGSADNPDYFTMNFAFGRYTPVHVLNIRELAAFLEAKGFFPIYRGINLNEKIAKDAYDGVPITHQIYNTCHLFLTQDHPG